MEARAQQLAFLQSQGVIGEGIQRRLRFDDGRSRTCSAPRQLTKSYAVASVPMMIVNGKYSTSVSEAGGTDAAARR